MPLNRIILKNNNDRLRV